jgi:uncharacterized protein (DUF2147 family)
MSRGEHREKRRGNSRAQATRRRMYAHMAILFLLSVGVFALMAFFIHHGKQSAAQPGPSPTTKESAAATGARSEFAPLKGRWMRPDGGYVIEIKAIDANGKMVAAYYNPRPINVSVAEAAMEGTTIKVFIELRDINYPGATYHLAYDSEKDQLRGVYLQPALQQSFDVFFVRLK